MIFAPITKQCVQMLQKKFDMLYYKFDDSNNNACVYIVLFLDIYNCDENASYFYYSIFRQKVSSGKSFMCRNLVELFVEFKFDKCMLTLPILYLLLYAQIRFGKITVQHTSCLVVAVKFLTPELVQFSLDKYIFISTCSDLDNFHGQMLYCFYLNFFLLGVAEQMKYLI